MKTLLALTAVYIPFMTLFAWGMYSYGQTVKRQAMILCLALVYSLGASYVVDLGRLADIRDAHEATEHQSDP